jgi:hypothetical protein
MKPHAGHPRLNSHAFPSYPQLGHFTAVKLLPQYGQTVAPAFTSREQLPQKYFAFTL